MKKSKGLPTEKLVGVGFWAIFLTLAYFGFRYQFAVYQKHHPGATVIEMMFDPEVKQ